MQQLLGDDLGPTTDNAFLKELFLQRLPANVRMVLASADATTDLPKLADMADKIMEVAIPPTVAATSTQPQVSEVQQLKEEITRLTELVASLAQQRPRGRSRSRSRNTRQQSPARADQQPPQNTDSVCWYHTKFGDAAKKCQPPCNWGNE